MPVESKINRFNWDTYLLHMGKILIHLFLKLIVQTFKPLIIIYRRCNFVYHYWGCTSIYWQLSYPFRSLQIHTYIHIIYVERISWESASSHISESRIWNFNAYLSRLLHLPLSLSYLKSRRQIEHGLGRHQGVDFWC